MRVLNVAYKLLLLVLLANCSIDVAVEDLKGNDFLRSSVVSNSRGIGDGVTAAVVVIELRNSDDSLVTGHTPDLSLANTGSSGITYYSCTPSDQLGLSTCTIKAIIVGVKTIVFNNIEIGLSSDIFFDPPKRDGNFFQLISAGAVMEDASGYSVTTQLGSPYEGLKQEVDGYQIYISTTGAITPTE
ncbi:MAG: hypothetical protein KDD33_05850 [Bdellovibrionales bacterium]|nr:hypothetical protein [Bdellovibrionales bacterium]